MDHSAEDYQYGFSIHRLRVSWSLRYWTLTFSLLLMAGFHHYFAIFCSQFTRDTYAHLTSRSVSTGCSSSCRKSSCWGVFPDSSAIPCGIFWNVLVSSSVNSVIPLIYTSLISLSVILLLFSESTTWMCSGFTDSITRNIFCVPIALWGGSHRKCHQSRLITVSVEFGWLPDRNRLHVSLRQHSCQKNAGVFHRRVL